MCWFDLLDVGDVSDSRQLRTERAALSGDEPAVPDVTRSDAADGLAIAATLVYQGGPVRLCTTTGHIRQR